MKKIKLKNFIFLFLALILLTSCETKERAVEKIKVSLSHIPFIKNYITLYPAPEKLYTETEDLMNQLKYYKAQEVFKDEYEKVLSLWEKAKDLYQSKYYKSAEKELKKVNSMAKELLKKVKTYKETLKTSALNKYKKMEELAEQVLKNAKSEEKRLQIKLYLWKLKTLIDMENYNEFEKELQNPPF